MINLYLSEKTVLELDQLVQVLWVVNYCFYWIHVCRCTVWATCKSIPTASGTFSKY